MQKEMQCEKHDLVWKVSINGHNLMTAVLALIFKVWKKLVHAHNTTVPAIKWQNLHAKYIVD